MSRSSATRTLSDTKGCSSAAAKSAKAAAAPANATHSMKIEELAGQVGMTVRNVRAYNSAGLLSPPTLRGRLGLYGEEHLAQLQVIRSLRDQGMTLERIKALVRAQGSAASRSTWQRLGDLAHALAQHMPQTLAAERVSVAEIEDFWQHPLTPALAAMMERSGLQRVLPEGVVEHVNPAIRPPGRRMAELGMGLDRVLEIQENLSRELRLAIRSYLRAMLNDIAQRSAQQAPAQTLQQAELLLKEAPELLLQVVQGMVPVLLQQEIQRMAQAIQGASAASAVTPAVAPDAPQVLGQRLS